MCGRVVTASSPEELSDYMGVDEIVATLEGPDHNVAPTGQLPMVWVISGDTPVGTGPYCRGTTRCLGIARWGLVPSWVRDPSIGNRLFNARSETVAEKPSFRSALRHRRCLVPVDGFYEWGPVLPDSKERSRKQPWYVHRSDGNPMVLAGLWEEWSGDDDINPASPMNTCTLITVTANADLGEVHHRMPAVLEPDSWADWLDPTVTVAGAVLPVLRPAAAGVIKLHPVDRRVGNTRNKGAHLLDEAAVPAANCGTTGDQEVLW
ncbi:MAG: SOS response-associated peptidase [Acidimicrobiales bacterium]|nr:SOS response-associated peptidase [Acidimicrobiales bacterium]|tara:strand:- start:2383 stop:3171 length:789 start_codon:yes stop_codon:yes gene_type:complete